MSLEFSFLSLPPLLGTDSRPSVGVQKDLSGCHGDVDLIIHLQDSSGKGRQRPWPFGESQGSKVRDKKESWVLDMRYANWLRVEEGTSSPVSRLWGWTEMLPGTCTLFLGVHSKPTARSSSDPC